ncbi:MAG: SMI1/KNR4 family protein [Deltaproteobacteria bacterium]|nr:SMI1/KNR4 family protein [Deltaproteobacteria bacterium]
MVERLRPHVTVSGADARALDRLEDRLGVELPPTLRRFLEFDFRFDSFGKRWHGRGRFGTRDAPHPRITSLTRIANAMSDGGWSMTRLRGRLVRLPNLPGQPWNALFLGESRSDGELPILGFVDDASTVIPFLRYSSFDRYLLDQSGLGSLAETDRLDDVESHLLGNAELASLLPDEDFDSSF